MCECQPTLNRGGRLSLGHPALPQVAALFSQRFDGLHNPLQPSQAQNDQGTDHDELVEARQHGDRGRDQGREPFLYLLWTARTGVSAAARLRVRPVCRATPRGYLGPLG